MLVVNGIFRDNTFVPDSEVHVPDGTRATVSIEGSDTKTSPEVIKQKKAWHDFFEGLKTLNEDLSPDFDKIIEKGISFNQADFS